MTPYTPQPGDVFRLEGFADITVNYLAGPSVGFSQGTQKLLLSISEFTEKATRTFSRGAELIRPTPMETTTPEPSGLSGSSNAHARLSPSSSKRWVNCTASTAYIEANAHRIPKDRSSPEADEGTIAHDWAAEVLVGKITEDKVPQSFQDGVMTYVNECRRLANGAPVKTLAGLLEDVDLGFDVPESVCFVEEKVPLFYQPDENGTADFVAILPGRVIVRDLKYGAGVLVDANENTQLAIYAFSFIKALGGAYPFTPDTIIDIAPVQPRHREADDIVPWQITLGDLEVFCADIEYRAIQSRTGADRVRGKTPLGVDTSCAQILEAAPGVKFDPSEGDSGACRWCPAKAFCEKRLAAATEGIGTSTMSPEDLLACMPDLDKEDSKLPVAERIALVSREEVLTDDYLVTIYHRSKAIKSYLSDVEDYLQSRLETGEEIGGVKLIDGRAGNRDWTNEDEAETFLRGQGLKEKERFTFKLKSPAQVEKILAERLKKPRTATRFNSLIDRSAPKKKIAPSTDKREPVQPTISIMPVVEDDFEV